MASLWRATQHPNLSTVRLLNVGSVLLQTLDSVQTLEPDIRAISMNGIRDVDIQRSGRDDYVQGTSGLAACLAVMV